MAERTDAAEESRVREFPAPGPVELELSNGVGPVEVELVETEVVRVEVRHEPKHGYPDWRGGLGALLSWVSEQINESGLGTGNGGESDRVSETAAEAVRTTRIDMNGHRLAVHPPTTVPLRAVPLTVLVRAPAGSRVNIHTGPGGIRVTGRAGRTSLQSGSGTVEAGQATGTTTVRTGSGRIRLGEMHAGVQARTGSGPVEIAAVEAASSVVTGSGSVWLGRVRDDLLVRSGSGGIAVAEATAGRVELITGSGEIQVAVGAGVHAEVDLVSSTGSVASELDVDDEPPSEPPRLHVFGRTGSGRALLTPAL
ncbi:DUF4097 family beta strand repeat-containing protein [Actinopolyspora mortivallis]|uniref:DUF4097 domain-containing protein n=1 Tax=Actinopolyspora mortivallis TaxID=33906 RepID=A0A2T0GZB6_ACTMO|nr:DUF4097 family beta strand repeat-containing protein [Actinopolyspora mortivallis]PRW64430.1 hypothetical protein CEP50_05815 [Actinopolyspora mortivallis]